MRKLRDNDPCGECDHGMYAVGCGIKHVDAWAAKPLEWQVANQSQCKLRPHIKCAGEGDIIRYITDDARRALSVER